MKSKLYSIVITTLILGASTAQGMYGFFTAARKVAFSNVMNKLQWATFIGMPVYDVGQKFIKGASFDGLPAIDRYKSDYILYKPTSFTLSDEQLDKMNTSYIQSIIKDPSVMIKYNGNLEDNAGAHHNLLNGKKYIILPYSRYIPEGVLYHEYGHIKNNHHLQQTLFSNLAPLALHTFFKKISNGYKLFKHGASALKNTIPSIDSTLSKIPQTVATYAVAKIPIAYQSRMHEREADDAIPAEYAAEAAEFLETVEGDMRKKYVSYPKPWYGKLLEKMLSSHPSIQERTEKLRARAATIGGNKE
jgi:hypothetical protein